ncbi:MAG: response regulator [Kiritimatiellae bacterium]|nr:response regulator [Kiritimatiellia bacterium]
MAEERILIIEDAPAMRAVLIDTLAGAGYAVTGAADGAEGVRLALSEAPDLVILDVMLPIVDGYDVCRTIRDHGLSMPVLMISAMSQETDIVAGLRLGADGYLTKPFGARQLLARVESLLRRRRMNTGSALQRGRDRSRRSGSGAAGERA